MNIFTGSLVFSGMEETLSIRMEIRAKIKGNIMVITYHHKGKTQRILRSE